MFDVCEDLKRICIWQPFIPLSFFSISWPVDFADRVMGVMNVWWETLCWHLFFFNTLYYTFQFLCWSCTLLIPLKLISSKSTPLILMILWTDKDPCSVIIGKGTLNMLSADLWLFSLPQTKERGSTRVHALNNVNKVLQVLHQNNVSTDCFCCYYHISWCLVDAFNKILQTVGFINQVPLRP